MKLLFELSSSCRTWRLKDSFKSPITFSMVLFSNSKAEVSKSSPWALKSLLNSATLTGTLFEMKSEYFSSSGSSWKSSSYLLTSSPESSSMMTTSKSKMPWTSSSPRLLSPFSSTKKVEPLSEAPISWFGMVHFSERFSGSSSGVSGLPTQLDLHLFDLVLGVVFDDELDHH